VPRSSDDLILRAAAKQFKIEAATIGDTSRMKKKTNELTSQLTTAIAACQDKKAEDLAILEMDKNSGAFTDYFVICSGSNPRQIQTISDEVELRLKRAGTYPNNIEGYKQAEWVLLDYVNFVVHVFSGSARSYYDLERLWRTAKKIQPADLIAKPRKRAVAKKAVRKRA
jgi:ribosome-associated protein